MILDGYFNPFVPNALFLYPLKTSENLIDFWCFQGVEKMCIGNKWFKSVLESERERGVANKKVKFILSLGGGALR